ncbi:thioredoxin family protein [Fulvivirga lutea]|uniref:Thioredoxin family protein n=1 Tax=Fulvivirga lutea TaxID=2810512 RepID=A0A975A133_9BACT|nr:thioredoxin family protein [Fulvivirga lutea]QSE98004.1 thioredoxin family protein [Fulvivirga lutea]
MKSKLLLLSALVLFFAGAPKAGYELGADVEDFTLKNVDGKEITLSEYGEKGAIVIFDCNTCPYSKAYLERIKELDAMYAPKGYPVVAVNSNDPNKSPDDSFDKMVEYADENEYEHAYVYDADQSVAKAFGATNTPHVFIVQKNGEKLVLKYIGAIDNNTRDAEAADKKYVQDAVDALLEGKSPETAKTKAIGCTIKWAS